MKKHTGFSLIELMVALLILGILMTVAVPNLSTYSGRKTLAPIGKLLDKALQITRIEAIQRGHLVYLAPKAADNWSSGWVVQFEDDQTPPVVQTIRTFDSVPSGTVITSSDYNSATPIIIQPNGQATRPGSFEIKQNSCLGGDKLIYKVKISGMFEKQVAPCI